MNYFGPVFLLIILWVSSSPSFPLFHQLQFNQNNDRYELNDSLSYHQTDFLPVQFTISSEQTYNRTLNKYQRQNLIQTYIIPNSIIRPFFRYQLQKDVSSLYIINSNLYTMGIFCQIPDNSLIDGTLESGYKSDQYYYRSMEINHRIDNRGYYHILQLRNKLAWASWSNMSDAKWELNLQQDLPYYITRFNHQWSAIYSWVEPQIFFHYLQSRHTYLRETIAEEKKAHGYQIGSKWKVRLKSMEYTQILTIDSTEWVGYYSTLHHLPTQKWNRHYFSQQGDFQFQCLRRLDLHLQHAYTRTESFFLNSFNNFYYEYALLGTGWNWQPGYASFQFTQQIEKDAFYFTDPLNLSDNDQLRLVIALKGELAPPGHTWRFACEFRNSRKKLVYISQYLSAGNFTEDVFQLKTEWSITISDNLFLSNGLRWEANYNYYHFIPDNNLLLRSLDYLLGINYKISSNWTVSFANNNQKRDYGPYILLKEKEYRFLRQNLRDRQYIEGKLTVRYPKIEGQLFFSQRYTDYRKYRQNAYERTDREHEYSAGMHFQILGNTSWKPKLSIQRQHYYGQSYWLISLEVTQAP